MTYIFLLEGLTGYWLGALGKLTEVMNAETEVIVVVWKWHSSIRKGTDENGRIKIYGVDNMLSFDELVNRGVESGSRTLVAGWRRKKFRKLSLQIKRNGGVTIMGMDNQWRGSLRQHVACLFGGIAVRRWATYAWVPGIRQYVFARRLGFGERNVLLGFLSANNQFFVPDTTSTLSEKSAIYPRKILFVGRFVPEKNLKFLINGFKNASKDILPRWRLVLIGSGDMTDVTGNEEYVEIKKYATQTEIAHEMREAGAFCIASRTEAWGVVIHEAACSGLPIICSDACGAATQFVQHGLNGYIFRNNDARDFEEQLTTLLSQPAEELVRMGKRSHELSKSITRESWCSTFINLR